MTKAQRRLVEAIRDARGIAEFWPVVNDWVNDSGPHRALALRNINRTVAALIRDGHITLDDNGEFHLTNEEPTND